MKTRRDNRNQDVLEEAICRLRQSPVDETAMPAALSAAKHALEEVMTEEVPARTGFDTLKSGIDPTRLRQSKGDHTMKTGACKKVFATAAVLGGILLLGWLISALTSRSIAFADVIEKLNEVRTASYEMTIEIGNAEPITYQIQVMEPGRIRTRLVRPGGGAITILDFQQGKGLALNDETRTATLIDLKGVPAEAGQVNHIEQLRGLRDRQSQALGKSTVDGKDAQGFLVEKGGIRITLWADAKTGLPLRMEWDRMAEIYEMKIVLSNFAYNMDLDPSLFSLEVPEGFTPWKTEVDTSIPLEERFMQLLRMFAELAEDHTFPPSLNLKELGKAGRKLGEKNLTHEQMIEIGAKLGGFIAFTLDLQRNGCEWHYAGKGVQLGTPDTPIFWWRRKDAQKWSVVYADLTIKENVDGAGLPQTP